MHRISSHFLGVLMTMAFLFPACSGDDDDTPEPDASPTDSPEPSETPAASPLQDSPTPAGIEGDCAEDSSSVLRIHYKNPSVSYSNLYMWSWGAWEEEKDIASCGEDGFGAVFDLPRAYFDDPDAQTMGFKFKAGEGTGGPWYEFDRSWTEGEEPWEVWIVRDDPTLYDNQEEITLVKLKAVYWDGPTTLEIELSDAATGADDPANYSLDHGAEVLSISGSGTKFTLTTSELDVQTGYTLSFYSADEEKTLSNGLYPRDVMDAFTTEEQLGAWIDESGNTQFRLWAPRATEVTLYTASTTDGAAEGSYTMSRDVSSGVWSYTISGNQHGLYYWYTIAGPEAKGEHFDASRPLNDPYALVALSSWGDVAGRGMVFDLSLLDPPTPVFPDGRRPVQDLVAYETHVRDLTGHETSGLSSDASEYRRYLGFTVDGLESVTTGGTVSTGLAHLKDLGVTAVQILPIQEFPYDPETFNWGYFTANFFSPEGAYASDDTDDSKLFEFKQMIDALHEAGIAVILDVVFNHTAEGSDQSEAFFNFKGMDSKYFYRQDPFSFAYSNGSGVGNELATERPMARRFVLDCLRYYVEVMGVDGFRFDLAGLLDLDTAEAIAELASSYENLYIYGEPWAASGALWSKGSVNDMEPWAVFNDDFRNTIKGSPEGGDKGFIQGNVSKSSVKTAISGSSVSFGSTAWADSPLDSLLYMDAHDNLTLADKLEVSMSSLSIEDKRARTRLAAAVTLTSLGPIMLHAGVDFMRSKPYSEDAEDGRPIQDPDSSDVFDANSYSSPDSTNNLNWQSKVDNLEVFEYFKGMIALRLSAHGQAARVDGPVTESYFEWLEDVNNSAALGYTLNADGSREVPRMRVLLNPSSSKDAVFSTTFESDKDWKLVADSDQVVLEGIEAVEGETEVTVPPLGIRIYVDSFGG